MPTVAEAAMVLLCCNGWFSRLKLPSVVQTLH